MMSVQAMLMKENNESPAVGGGNSSSSSSSMAVELRCTSVMTSSRADGDQFRYLSLTAH